MKRNLLLLVGVILLAVVPLLIYSGQDEANVFLGTDAQAEAMIAEMQPDYQPWYSSFWEPPSAEIESMLFALQAAIGAGLVCYCIGYYRGRHVKHTKDSKS